MYHWNNPDSGWYFRIFTTEHRAMCSVLVPFYSCSDREEIAVTYCYSHGNPFVMRVSGH